MNTIKNDYKFKMDATTEMTELKLADFISKHIELIEERYSLLHNAYMGMYPILNQESKAVGKPDNRIVVNFAKFIVDSMAGFFIGIPFKETSPDESVVNYLSELNAFNDMEDGNAELSKLMSIYGKAYEMYWLDDRADMNITYLSPMEAFMVYDYSVVENPLYFVRIYKGSDKLIHGTLMSNTYTIDFVRDGGIQFNTDTLRNHGFAGVPATEFIENEERQAIFENVYTLINAYNKAISEKANDVDYFSDSYLEIVGPEVGVGDVSHIRENRIINFETDDPTRVRIGFLEKPSADTMQENLINRLSQEIYAKSMVMNFTDENFGTSSGIALKYKLFAMSNLARVKERKFVSGLNHRYKTIFSHPTTNMHPDAWTTIEYHFSLNYPANVLEEAQAAAQLSGITSKATQLKTLSIVDNVSDELERIKEEEKENMDSVANARLGYDNHFVDHDFDYEAKESNDENSDSGDS